MRLWKWWMVVARVLGTIQMIVFLTVVYWLILPFIAIPYRFFGDPFRQRRKRSALWVEQPPDGADLDRMRRQY